ncbi:TraR/DksA family transcriptional regulator [Catellatospora paridis]|uniref:TraR/DksA family transcriptional regulator n=1 Tax=Catellatospora paridis TaxID=1617086 RepID=UPI0012D375B3|nr:TraR/DksA C4-type zinc finger protein [Catellatospora paridis]
MTTLDTTDHDDWLAGIHERLKHTCDEQTAHLSDLTAAAPDASEAAAHGALLAGTRQSLADTVAALRRIEQGRYGACEVCAAAIPLARLDLLPHARTCVACPR